MSMDDPERATPTLEHGQLGVDLHLKAREFRATLLREEARLQSALEILQASRDALALIEERALRRLQPASRRH
jgi:hypothetical protein